MKRKTYVIALAVLAMAAVAVSCEREKEVAGVTLEKGEIAFYASGTRTRSAAQDAVLSHNSYALGTADGMAFTLEEEVMDLDAASGPATKGTPVYTENYSQVHKSLSAEVFRGTGSYARYESNAAFDFDGEKFWKRKYPNDFLQDGNSALFFLRMPASPAGVCDLIPDPDDPDAPKLNFTYESPKSAQEQEDILFAITKLDDKYKEKEGAPVLFRHALTGVKFAIGNNTTTADNRKPENETQTFITKVTVKLLPLPPYRLDILAIYTDVNKAVTLVPSLVKAGLNPTSVEFMDNKFVRAASDYSELRLPHYEDGTYLIVTIETFNEDELDSKMEQLAEICEESGAVDVLEADDRVWKVRRNCLEGARVLSKVSSSDDLVVPLPEIANCINHLMEVSKDYDFELFCLAHAGDGNLHFQILKCDMSDEEWEKQVNDFHAIAYAYVYSLGGRLSGEHGIGSKKVGAMAKYTNPVELKLMKQIKKAMDPLNVLNPYKVIDNSDM